MNTKNVQSRIDNTEDKATSLGTNTDTEKISDVARVEATPDKVSHATNGVTAKVVHAAQEAARKVVKAIKDLANTWPQTNGKGTSNRGRTDRSN